MRLGSTTAMLLGAGLAGGCRPGAARPAPVPAPAPAPAAARDPVRPDTPPPAEVAAMLAEIEPRNLKATVERLAGFGTRHTLSGVEDESRGIGAARRWLQTTLAGYVARRPGGAPLHVDIETHHVAPDGKRIDHEVDVVNVLATLPGAMPEAAGRHYYVVAHYDSRATDPMDCEGDAPGANDDASGVAVVLELARVMASRRFDATLVFMATAGEEQGLVGAELHARAAAQADVDIEAVLDNDIVGDPTGPSGEVHAHEVRLFSPGIRDLARRPGAGADPSAGGRERLALARACPLRRRGRRLAGAHRASGAGVPARPPDAGRRPPRVRAGRIRGGPPDRGRGDARPPAPNPPGRGRPGIRRRPRVRRRRLPRGRRLD